VVSPAVYHKHRLLSVEKRRIWTLIVNCSFVLWFVDW
jgi:hypothetical protein